MSARHPIIAVTGSSGAGTTTVKTTFEWIFRREKIDAAIVEGDAFHRYDRVEMRQKMKDSETAGNQHFSHFGPEANLFGELEALFRSYALSGKGRSRTYIHDADEAARHGGEPGTFTPWTEVGEGSDLLFYEGLHGAIATEEHDVARHVDLLVGVAPSINLEWIQKLHRDRSRRGYSTEAVVDTVLRRMPDLHEHHPLFKEVKYELIVDRDLEPSNSIIRFAEDRDVGMIVMATHGRKGLRRVYIGNNTAEVVRQSSRPVLTISHPFHRRIFTHPLTEQRPVDIASRP